MPELFGTTYRRADLNARAGRFDALAGIDALERIDGRGRGVREYRVRSGDGFSFTAIGDRALDVALADYGGVPLCWSSCNEIAAAAMVDERDNGFLETFMGGLFTTCGLANFGPPGSDAWGTFGLHGRIDGMPARDVRTHTAWNGDDCVLEIAGTIRETRVFGENFRLDRRLRTQVGTHRLALHDTVTNEAGTTRPHMLLYHCNGGFPILADEAQLYVAHAGVRPRDAEAERGFAVWDRGGPPHPGFKEQVFIHEPVACSDGRALAMLWNGALRGGAGLGLAIRFDPRQLPGLFTWRMLGSGTYVMGMEPANCVTIEGRVAAGKNGTLPMLEPGESRTYDLEFDVVTSHAEFAALRALLPVAVEA